MILDHYAERKLVNLRCITVALTFGINYHLKLNPLNDCIMYKYSIVIIVILYLHTHVYTTGYYLHVDLLNS